MGCSIFRKVSIASGPKRNNEISTQPLLCGRECGYPGSNLGSSNLGCPPTAFRRFAASVRCSISSTTTLLITSTASTLRPGSIEYNAQRYGGMVACSNSIAHCRCCRRLSREAIVPAEGVCMPAGEVAESASLTMMDVELNLFIGSTSIAADAFEFSAVKTIQDLNV